MLTIDDEGTSALRPLRATWAHFLDGTTRYTFSINQHADTEGEG